MTEKRKETKKARLSSMKDMEDIINLVKLEFLTENKIFPLKIVKQSNSVRLAMIDPTDLSTIDNFRLATGYDVEPISATQEQMDKWIKKAKKMKLGLPTLHPHDRCKCKSCSSLFD